MSLTRILDKDEWDILSIVTDPILLGEFLRNTADGSPTKEEWPKQKFGYRWYQKDLLSDKSEFISLVAGRAVGKCSPMHSKIYTHPFGYMAINDLMGFRGPKLLSRGPVTVHCIDPETKELTQRRFSITKNGRAETFTVTTATGHTFRGTANHPILTQRGYVMIQDLTEDDQATVATFLPHISGKEEFTWEELRWLGYAAGADHVRPEMYYTLKYQRNIIEMQQIATYFDAKFERMPNGMHRLLRKRGPLQHYISKIIKELKISNIATDGFRRIPPRIKAESLAHNKIFLESFLSCYAEFTNDTITFSHIHKSFVQDIQEFLLRFGVESRIEKREDYWWLTIEDYYSYWQLFQVLDIPGVTVKNLRLPLNRTHPTGFMRFDDIISVESFGTEYTFAVTVHDHENYISDNLFVHNSLVLEDKIIYEAVNVENVFTATKESLLVTPNVAQMTPILDRLIMRLGNSHLLKDFLRGNINRSKGTMDFPQPGGSNYRIHARIAGSKGEQNMVGLHVPKIIGDEQQIMPMAAFTQLMPAYNGWEPNSSQLFTGVPNGIREGSVLYFTDQRSPKFKKYRIPAHQNPYYTYEDDRENLLKYGGEESDDYQHLVLGRHGDPAFSIIPRDKIRLEPFDFWTHRYTQTDKHAGRDYKMQLPLHKLPENKSKTRILAVDTGYADPTVAQVMGQDANGIWRTFVRYRLTRIPFPEQADAIDYLDSYYNFNMICVDLGAGGGGIGVTQDLQSNRFSKGKRYDKRIYGVRFADFLENGETAAGTPLKIQAKSYAGQELARLITEGQVIFSELDMEGVSQIERVAYQRRSDGTNQYFILSERGTGKSGDDHIFASYVVFTLTLLTSLFEKPRKKLASPRW
jgi:hypothetical protein